MKTMIAIVVLAAAASAAAAQRTRPVMTGGAGPDVEACPGSGEVHGLNPRGDNFLSVRAGPDARAREVGRLGPGEEVIVCDRSRDRRWWGVVYGVGNQDCALVAARRPRPYAGPCRSGWVSARYLRVIG